MTFTKNGPFLVLGWKKKVEGVFLCFWRCCGPVYLKTEVNKNLVEWQVEKMNSLNNKSFLIKDIIEKGDGGDELEEGDGKGEDDELKVGVMGDVQVEGEEEEEEEVASLSSGV